MTTTRTLRTALVAAGIAIGTLLSGGVSGQAPAIIKGIDPVTKRVVDLGDISQNLVLLQRTSAAMQQQLQTLNARLLRPLDVNVKAPALSGPCTPSNTSLLDVAISQTASATLVSGRPGLRIGICQIRVVAGVAEITSELEGTGSACGTATIVHSGSATAAQGESWGANGGYQDNQPFFTRLAGNDFCLGQSGSSRVSGKLTYTFIP